MKENLEHFGFEQVSLGRSPRYDRQYIKVGKNRQIYLVERRLEWSERGYEKVPLVEGGCVLAEFGFVTFPKDNNTHAMRYFKGIDSNWYADSHWNLDGKWVSTPAVEVDYFDAEMLWEKVKNIKPSTI